jgi:3D (Asp-Asp-Asp) domain-containing protein
VRVVPILVVLTACGGGSAAMPDGGDSGADATPRPDPGPSLGSFQLTYYYVASETDYAGIADTALYADDCAELATVPLDFADDLDIEGTGRLADGRLINVAGACACPRSPCYVEADADHPWGYGVENRALVPFVSIAVDPGVISYGTGIYLPELDGVVEPGGTTLDGCVVAADTGGGIVGEHIDYFVGLRDTYHALDDALGLTDIEVRDGGDRCADEP